MNGCSSNTHYSHCWISSSIENWIEFSPSCLSKISRASFQFTKKDRESTPYELHNFRILESNPQI